MNVTRRQLLEAMGWGGIGALCLFCGCKTVPSTGRRQVMLISEKTELELADQAYEAFLQDCKTSQNVPLSQLVNRVGQRLASVVDKPEYSWDFQLVASADQNAFCLPGGKLVVFEGLLPLCETEAGLAAVMAHQISHAIHRHGGERMSQSLTTDSMRIAAGKISGKPAPARAELLMQAYGANRTAGETPGFSQKQEWEADEAGVMMMARAGYDPNEAPRLWNQLTGITASKRPELTIIHPTEPRRSTQMIALMGEASQLYAAAEQKHGRGKIITHSSRAS